MYNLCSLLFKDLVVSVHSLFTVNKLSRAANKKAQTEKAVNSKQATLIDISKSSDEEVKVCKETKPCASPSQSRGTKETKPCASPSQSRTTKETKPCASPSQSRATKETKPCVSPSQSRATKETNPFASPSQSRTKKDVIGECWICNYNLCISYGVPRFRATCNCLKAQSILLSSCGGRKLCTPLETASSMQHLRKTCIVH